MASDWIVVTERGAAQPTVSRYVGGFSKTALSAAFGTNLGSDDITSVSPFNCGLQVSAVTIYAVLFDGLYRSTDGGATFASIFAFPSPAADLTRRICHGGLHVAYDSGSQEIIIGGWVATSIASTIQGWTYNLTTGTPGTPVNQGVLGSSDEICGSEILYGTSVHFNYGDGFNQNQWFAFDLVAQSWASFSLPAGGGTAFNKAASSCYAVASDGALYLVLYGFLGGVIGTTELYRFTGSWAFAGALETQDDNGLENGARAARIALFSDGTDLQAVTLFGGPTVSSHGWHHWTITAASNFDATQAINRTVLNGGIVPLALRNVTDGGSANVNGDKRCIVVQDTETTPGTLVTLLAFSDDASPGTPFAVYLYRGIVLPYLLQGSGGAVRDALPQASRNGGGYFFTPTQDGIEILSVAPTTGGETITFRASGGGTITVQFRRSRQQQGATGLATLVGPVTGGGSLGTNQVTGVTADGFQLNTVTWNFFADTVPNNEALVVLVPEKG